MQRIIFLNLSKNRFSRTKAFYSALAKNYPKSVIWIEIENFKDLIKKIYTLKLNRYEDKIVVTSRSQILVLYCLSLMKRVYLDAGLSLTEGTRARKPQLKFYHIQICRAYLVDLLSFHLSKVAIFETHEQIAKISKYYFVKKRKLKWIYIGCDEFRFEQINQKKLVASSESKNQDVFHILFRGGNQIESGISVMLKAAQLLKNNSKIKFTLITNKLEINRENYRNIDFLIGYVSDSTIANRYRNAHVVLGQLTLHNRLNYAIPHKFFEAAFFAKPYLTSKHGILLPLIEQGIVAGFEGNSSSNLAENLIFLSKNQDQLNKLAVNLKHWYEKNSTQKILTAQFFQYIDIKI